MWGSRITIEEVNDPVEVQRRQEQREQFQRNCNWLRTHWPDLLPQAIGKFLAVAGQEAFLAETAEAARALALARHPNEKGLFLEYVVPARGPRFYGEPGMLIRGDWSACSDGVIRPTVMAAIVGVSGQALDARFLVDSAADGTVPSADILNTLQLPTHAPPPGLTYQGVGGGSPIVIVSAVLEFARADGGKATVRGQFAALTDPHATDICILGRDVLDHFEVILSRRRNEILLLAPIHHYTVAPP